MEKLIIEELNKLSKWVITKNISFIGHEWSSSLSLFTFIKIDDVNIHLEIFFDGVNIESVVNCFRNKEHLFNFSGKTEECLLEIDSMKF
jgi:hypothetical protein